MSNRTRAALEQGQMNLFEPPEFNGEISIHDAREGLSKLEVVWGEAECDDVMLRNGESPVSDLRAANHFLVALTLLDALSTKDGLRRYKNTDVGSFALSYAYENKDKDLITALSEQSMEGVRKQYKEAHARAVGTFELIKDGSKQEWALQRQNTLRKKHERVFADKKGAAARKQRINELKAFVAAHGSVDQR